MSAVHVSPVYPADFIDQVFLLIIDGGNQQEKQDTVNLFYAFQAELVAHEFFVIRK